MKSWKGNGMVPFALVQVGNETSFLNFNNLKSYFYLLVKI